MADLPRQLSELYQSKGDLVAMGTGQPERLSAPTQSGRVLRTDLSAATNLNWTDSFQVIEVSGSLGPNVGDWVELVSFYWGRRAIHLGWLFTSSDSEHTALYAFTSVWNATGGQWQWLPPIAHTLYGLGHNFVLQINTGYDTNDLNRTKLRVQRRVGAAGSVTVNLVLLMMDVREVTALTATGNEAVVTTMYSTDLLPILYLTDPSSTKNYTLQTSLRMLPQTTAPSAPASGVNLYVSSSDGRLKLGRSNGDVLEMETASTQYLAWAGM